MTAQLKLKQEPLKPTELYDQRVADIEQNLIAIKRYVIKLDRREYPNWGHAGDLARIIEPLNQIKHLLKDITKEL